MSNQPIKQKLAKLSKKVKLNQGDKELLQEIAVASANGNLSSIFKDSAKRIEAFELSNKIQSTLYKNKWRHYMVFARKIFFQLICRHWMTTFCFCTYNMLKHCFNNRE